MGQTKAQKKAQKAEAYAERQSQRLLEAGKTTARTKEREFEGEEIQAPPRNVRKTENETVILERKIRVKPELPDFMPNSVEWWLTIVEAELHEAEITDEQRKIQLCFQQSSQKRSCCQKDQETNINHTQEVPQSKRSVVRNLCH